MFDPFRDFSTAGYLRNKHKEQDARIIKTIEHEVFARHLPKAIQHLSNKKTIVYEDFLAVHRILFFEFYPWAGQDRTVTAPDISVSKSGIQFCHPVDVRRAVDEGLRLAQTKGKMTESPGLVMGFFAYGHPFLDGNGRTMLLAHMELAYRAGFSIAWADTNKEDYLAALSNEIKEPGRGILDAYLLQFKGAKLARDEWGKSVLSMKGLGGLDDDNRIDGDLIDAAVAEKYRQFELKRGYTYAVHCDGPLNTIGVEPETTISAHAWLATWAIETGKTVSIAGQEHSQVAYTVAHIAPDGVVLDKGLTGAVYPVPPEIKLIIGGKVVIDRNGNLQLPHVPARSTKLGR